MRRSQSEFLVLLSAFDEIFSTTVQTRTSYTPDEIICGARFANAFMLDAAQQFTDGAGKNRKVAVDMRLFDNVESVADTSNR